MAGWEWIGEVEFLITAAGLAVVLIQMRQNQRRQDLAAAALEQRIKDEIGSLRHRMDEVEGAHEKIDGKLGVIAERTARIEGKIE